MTAQPAAPTGLPGESLALVRALAPGLLDDDAAEVAVTVDQTNDSVIVGGAAVVKWLRPPVVEPHPGVMLMAHLGEVGFAHMPAFHGALVEQGIVLAVVTAYVPDSADGWEWFVDELLDVIDGRRPESAFTASASAIGRLTAELHLALRTPSTVIAEPLSSAGIAALRARAAALLDQALAVTDGEPGRALAAREDVIRQTLAGLDDIGEIEVQPIHGDLHAGQFLRSAHGLSIVDFDGNPVDDDRDHAAGPTALDVASMVQSIDHVGRVAIRRRPEHAERLETLLGAAMNVALDAYRSAAGAADLVDERLLPALRAMQELHEFVYAARHLPHWVYVPHGAIEAMFPTADGTLR